MLIRFYRYDGITPYVEARTVMVGGTQEDPVLGTERTNLVVNCPDRKVGDKFKLRTNGGWGNPLFEVFKEGEAKQVLK